MPKIILMAIPLSPLSGASSEVRTQFLQPLHVAYHHATTIRQCPAESDWDWLTKGVDRVLSNVRSGRDFLQTFQMFWSREVQVGPYFETLASPRRLSMVAECSALLRRRVDALQPSPLSQFEALTSFELYAGDGHYLEHATHDPMQGETHWPTGHFFALNLKSQSLFPLVLADLAQRKKEQDLRALKRQSVAMLRQGAGKGRKVMWVWDKAAVDFPFWQERKASGVYFLSLRKKGMCLEVQTERVIDVAQLINQGVTADRVVTDRRGIRVREITFHNPCDGEGYVYLTTEMTLEPGLLALLYKTRWEIEKVFDETKTKLAEKKSWATNDDGQADAGALCGHRAQSAAAPWGLASATRRGKHRRTPAPAKAIGPTGNRTEENGADPAAGLQNPPALHPGDVQTHPLAARPLASPHLAASSPAPATLPLRQTLTRITKHQCNLMLPGRGVGRGV